MNKPSWLPRGRWQSPELAHKLWPRAAGFRLGSKWDALSIGGFAFHGGGLLRGRLSCGEPSRCSRGRAWTRWPGTGRPQAAVFVHRFQGRPHASLALHPRVRGVSANFTLSASAEPQKVRTALPPSSANADSGYLRGPLKAPLMPGPRGAETEPCKCFVNTALGQLRRLLFHRDSRALPPGVPGACRPLVPAEEF